MTEEVTAVKTENPPTLFERLGGTEAVRAVVDDFYDRVLADAALAPFFEGKKVASLRYHQLRFLKVAFTHVPDDLDVPKMMIDKHRRLFESGLNETHFDKVAGHLVAALTDAGVSSELIAEAAAIVVPLRRAFEAGSILHGGTTVGEEKKDDMAQVLRATTPEGKAETLMDRLGGASALKAAVHGLYPRLLDDPDVSSFFQEINMAQLKIHQLEFFKVAFGQVPDNLDVMKLMKDKHSKLFAKGLNATHFDKVAQHFAAALKELNVAPEVVDEAVGVIAPLREAFEQGALEAAKRN